jgi:site-specific DNA-methyltransferase (adenine-specific)
MKFKPEQGRRLQSFIAEVSMEVMRVLKPGGFFIAFACPRLYHRLAVAVEDAGFEIRDMLVWEHQGGQGKAFKLDHVVHGTREMSAEQQAALIASMEGRQTPQVKPRHEPFVLAQKPKNGNFIQNWERWQTGLVRMRFDGRQQDTVFEYNKPRLRKRHDHMTIKPQELMERIIEMFSVEGQVVLDPFMGSGTTGAAAQKTGRAFVGIEKEPDYFSQAEMRIRGAVV